MSSKGAALVESVAHALSCAIDHRAGQSCFGHNSSFYKCNRSVAQTRHAAAVFDSSVIPPIGIDKYLVRLNSTFKCSDATWIAALILVDRLLEYDGGHLPLTMRNVHRIFLASLVVAVKFHEDLVYSNKHYAKAGGVQLREVNRLERVLLMTLDFNLRVHPDQYRIYEATLYATHGSLKVPSNAGTGNAHKPSTAPTAKDDPSKSAVAQQGSVLDTDARLCKGVNPKSFAKAADMKKEHDIPHWEAGNENVCLPSHKFWVGDSTMNHQQCGSTLATAVPDQTIIIHASSEKGIVGVAPWKDTALSNLGLNVAVTVQVAAAATTTADGMLLIPTGVDRA